MKLFKVSSKQFASERQPSFANKPYISGSDFSTSFKLEQFHFHWGYNDYSGKKFKNKNDYSTSKFKLKIRVHIKILCPLMLKCGSYGINLLLGYMV
jgi:hypothetical protein